MPSVILSDNGVSSGSAGLKTTASNDGSLALQTTTAGGTATTAVTIDTSQNVTFAGSTSVQGITVGRGAGSVATNTAVGSGVLASGSQTGARNSAGGYIALAANTSGSDNTAYGGYSLTANTTGGSNSAFGVGALQSNTTGGSNFAAGYGALLNNTTASNNTAVGYQAGYSNTTGFANTFIGYQAGYYTNRTDGVSGRNVFVGEAAGYANTTGRFNSYLGHYAGSDITTGSGNTIIGRFGGNSGGLDIRTASNAVVLSDGDGNPRFYSSSAGGDYLLNQPAGGSNTSFVLSYLGTGKWWIWRDYGSDRLNITPASFASGVYLTNTATSWAAYSDRRIKSDIVDLEYGIATIMAMQPRRYTVTANGENSIGFIAQELKTVLPEAVVGEEIEFNDDDTPQERSSKTMGISKETIIPVLVKAIQELKAEFDAYKEAHP